MGWLAAQGAIMAIGLFIGLVCSVIRLFFGHIILFDSIALGIVGGLLMLIYAAVFGLLAYFISEHDPIWGWVIFGLVFLVVGALHLRARDS